MDDGKIADTVWGALTGRVDAALELVGCGAVPDTPAGVRAHGTSCFTGALDDQWKTIRDFGFVSYGGVAAGTRAARHLEQVLTTLKTLPVVGSVSSPLHAPYIDDNGRVRVRAKRRHGSADSMLDGRSVV
jgi:hypothetical protein